jgi:hypothetical protein
LRASLRPTMCANRISCTCAAIRRPTANGSIMIPSVAGPAAAYQMSAVAGGSTTCTSGLSDRATPR